MSYGKTLKKNFYSQGGGDIAMPPVGEMPPVLADTPELFSGRDETSRTQPSTRDNQSHVEQTHPMVRNNFSQEDEDAKVEHEEPDDIDIDEPETEEEETVQVSQQKQKAKPDHPNFKSLREAAQRAEWERDTLKSQMLEMQRAMQNQYPSQVQQKVEQPEPEVDDFNFDIEDDALLEGKHAKKLVQELKNVKKQLRQFHSQSSETALDAKIRNNFPDFNEVVSVENVRRLNEEHPDIAEALRDTPDKYKMASSAYSIMKKFGIHKDMTYEEDKMKAIKNSQKPRPVASVSPQQGDSPLSKANAFANGLSKDLQKQLLAEMAAARKAM